MNDQVLAQVVPVILKLLLASLLGGAIGLEREARGRPAGIRTHVLVAMGVVLFCETSKVFGGDAGRIAAQVVTGIGFLGAGTIMRQGSEVHGLTTAASIWATSAIGMAVSVGGRFSLVACIATCLILAILVLLMRVEMRFFRRSQIRDMFVVLRTRAALLDLLAAFGHHNIEVQSVRIASEAPQVEIEICVGGSNASALEVAIAQTGVLSARWH